MSLSETAALELCDQFVDSIDLGSGASSIEVFKDETLLVIYALPATSFPDSVIVAGEAVATANAILNADPVATGLANNFKIKDGDGNVLKTGTVGTFATDMVVPDTQITVGTPCSISSWIYKQALN